MYLSSTNIVVIELVFFSFPSPPNIVIFVAGTRFYIIKKPQKGVASRLYVDVPVSIVVSLLYTIFVLM